MKSVLLIGQSNMAGRGDFGEVPEIQHPRCFMMRNGRWVTMSEPINPDRPVFGSWHSGVGLSASFAEALADSEPGIKVGLIPCADGGTSLDEWMPGGELYDNAVFHVGLAKRSSDVVAVLWHQGEQDCISADKAAAYRGKLEKLFAALRRDAGLEGVPFVVGELGRYFSDSELKGLRENFGTVNAQLHAAAEADPLIAIASSEGLACKADKIHFDSKSYRELGRRYYRAYRTIAPTLPPAGASKKATVMFIGAHPDDLEACIGLALRMKERYTVQVVDFTRGEGGCGEAGFLDGTTAVKRVAEERDVCKAFGIEPIFLSQVNFQGRLAFADAKVTSEIVELLLKMKPRAVFTHWPVDTHPDHVQCSAAVQHAVSIAERHHSFRTELYFFSEPPWQTKNFRPTYYVDVTDVAELTRELVSKYVCQDGAKIAANKMERMASLGSKAPRPVKYAEIYTTFTGDPEPKGVLAPFAISGGR